MTYTREQLLEAAEILDRSHDVILAKGWWPGNGYENDDNDESRCITAAVLDVLGTLPEDVNVQCCAMPSPGRMERWLMALLSERVITAPWNDKPGRTEDEVFDRLRSVAKELREEAQR